MRRAREYLSFSQLSLLKSSEKSYIDRYIHNKGFSTKSTRFGNEIAETIEKEEGKHNDLLKIIIPSGGISEYELSTSFMKVPLFGKLDKFFEDELKVEEYKTRNKKHPWTQKEVDDSLQLKFYSLMVYAKFKELPREFILRSFETDYENGELMLTGNTNVFEYKPNMADVLKTAALASKSWKRIGELCEEEYKKLGI